MPVNSKLIDGHINLDPSSQLTNKHGVKGGYRAGEWSGSTYGGLKSSISANVSTLKTEMVNERGNLSLTTEGPGAGGELGLSLDQGVAAMVEARVAQATGKAGPVFGTVGLNANTGFRLGGGWSSSQCPRIRV